MDDNTIVNIEFEEVIDKNEKIYTISQVTNMLKTSPTIINSIIV